MKIAHISLGDWAASAAGMTLEEEGFFWRMTRLMYANDGAFPDHDRSNAGIMGIDIRVYRRLKERLLGRPKPVIKAADGNLVNKRVLEEINRFCAAKKSASDRGKIGAATRWQNDEDRPDFGRTSAGLRPEVGRKSVSQNKEINDLAIATPTPTPYSYKKETPCSPPERGTPEDDLSADQEAMNRGLTGRDQTAQVSVAWGANGRLEVFNGFRAELLEQLGGDEIELRSFLDEAAGNVPRRYRDEQLLVKVRAQASRQMRWRRENAAKRRRGPEVASHVPFLNPSPEFEALVEAGRRRHAEIWGKRKREPAQ